MANTKYVEQQERPDEEFDGLVVVVENGEDTIATPEEAMAAFDAGLPKKRVQAGVVMSMPLDSASSIGDGWRRYVSFHRGKGTAESSIKVYFTCYKRMCQFISELAHYPDATKVPMYVMMHERFLEFYRIWLEDHGYKEQTILTSLRCFKALYYYFQDEEWLDRRKVKLNASYPELRPIFTQEQLEVLTVKPKIKDNFCEYRNWVIVVFALNTSCRCSSICGIKMRDCCELDDGYILIQRAKAKKPQRLAVPSKVVKIVKEYMRIYRDGAASEDYLFCNQFGESLSPHTCSINIIAYMKERLGDEMPERGGLHLLRHTFAANYLKSGGNIEDLRKQLMHRDTKMSLYYASHWQDPAHSSIENHAPINMMKVKAGRKKIK